MRYLYLDKDRMRQGLPSVAIRDERGNVEYADEVSFLCGRMVAPLGEPLTPTGPAAWVTARVIITRRHVRCLMALGSLGIWGLAIWAIMRWIAK